MQNLKKDFPIFANNPDMIFLDSGSSSQKPKFVIDGVNSYITHSYANIHRGLYEISEKSEEIYERSKSIVASTINCNINEIIYTYNATYGINLISQSLIRSKFLNKGDTVILGVWDHHANIVPRQVLSEMFGINIEYINIDDNYDIDREDFNLKYNNRKNRVKVVACSHISNVTGKIYDIKKIKSKLNENTFFLVDGSQSMPHLQVNVQDIDCDCFVFTGHKMMAYTGIGAVFLKKHWIKELSPMIVGGGAIKYVDLNGFTQPNSLEKFESGTPNLIGAISLGYAIEYINNIGGFDKLQEHDELLNKYALEQFENLEDRVTLIGPKFFSSKERISIYSFILKDTNNIIVGEKMAEKNIAIRCGGHCAHILHQKINYKGTCRVSCYIYNDILDLKKFFDTLSTI